MRHGTLTAARSCHCEACTAEQTRYVKFWRLRRAQGVRFRVPVGPSLRKVQALQRLGHTRASIAAEIGTSPQSLSNTLGREMIKATTEIKIEEAFRRLEMVIPPDTRESRRSRALAEIYGWLPPLAYDDIHEGVVAEVPGEKGYSHDRLDLDLVEDVMQYHDFTVKLSPREKSEVVRRWVANGRSERSLCALTGWREGRYRTKPTIIQGGTMSDGTVPGWKSGQRPDGEERAGKRFVARSALVENSTLNHEHVTALVADGLLTAYQSPVDKKRHFFDLAEVDALFELRPVARP